jgi:hypothetical protein
MSSDTKEHAMVHTEPGLPPVVPPMPKSVSNSPPNLEARSEIPNEVREFCTRKQINDELEQTIALARRHFALAGNLRFQVVDDLDCGEHYVGIHIQAEGQPEDVFQQSEAFLDSFLDQVETAKQKHISLIYHPTSH